MTDRILVWLTAFETDGTPQTIPLALQRDGDGWTLYLGSEVATLSDEEAQRLAEGLAAAEPTTEEL